MSAFNAAFFTSNWFFCPNHDNTPRGIVTFLLNLFFIAIAISNCQITPSLFAAPVEQQQADVAGLRKLAVYLAR
jgi:hypothetical protein